MAEMVGIVPLSAARQRELNAQKRATRIANEKYFRIHPELRAMTKAFLERVLESRPDDVGAFAAEFFGDEQLPERLGFEGYAQPVTAATDVQVLSIGHDEPSEDSDAPAADAPALTAVSGAGGREFEERMIQLFEEADVDVSGALDPAEFRTVMKTAQLGLTEAEIGAVLAEADYNGDGLIVFSEFLPLAVDVIQGMALRRAHHAADEANEDVMTADDRQAALALMMGVSEAAFAEYLHGAVVGAEGGRASRNQLRIALLAPHVGLTKRLVHRTIVELDMDADGKVGVDAVPRVLELLKEAFIEALGATAEARRDALADELVSDMRAADAGGGGMLPPAAIGAYLGRRFGFLSRLQIGSMLADAPVDAEGHIDYAAYAPTLAAMVRAYADPASIRERSEMSTRAQFAPIELMGGKERDQFKLVFDNLFREHDVDHNGYLDAAEFAACLAETELGLSAGEVRALMELADADADNRISYEEFSSLAYDVLLYMAREKAVFEQIKADGAPGGEA